jgi:O-antigen/teichoic acid export membrane protein
VSADFPLYRRVFGLFYSKLARASAWLFVGSIAGGILGYVFQVLMGRMLSTHEYGLFSAVMALFAVFSAPLGTLMMVISRKVSEYRAKEDGGSISHFYYSINARTAVIGAGILAVCFASAPQVQSYLKASNVDIVYLLGALLFLSFPPIVNNAFLQGMQSFSWLSASTSLGVLLKIVFSVALVWLGYGVSGALGGTILAALATGAITYGALYGPLMQGRGKTFQTVHLQFKPALPVFVANAAFAAMTQLDMVLVNYYFAAHEASMYAAASILGKAVMYLPGGIAMALFPMVAERHARNESSAPLLFQAVGFATLLCGAGAIFYFIFGEWFTTLLFGENYRDAGEVLKYFGFAILPMGLVLVAENFLVAKGRVLFAYLFFFIAPLQLTAIHFFHDSLRGVLAVIGVSGLVVAILGYGLLWRAFRNPKRAVK